MTIDQIIKEAREMLSGSTPGPWKFEDTKKDGPSDKVVWSQGSISGVDEEDETYNTICTMPNNSYGYSCAFHNNGEFITFARNNLGALLDELEKREKVLKVINSIVHDIDYQNDYIWVRLNIKAAIKSILSGESGER